MAVILIPADETNPGAGRPSTDDGAGVPRFRNQFADLFEPKEISSGASDSS